MSLLSRLAVTAAKAYGALSSKGGVSASYLVVAGGGGGGASRAAGGGGGGMRTSTATLSTLVTYTVTVGAGGLGGLTGNGQGGATGSNSVLSGTGFTTITSAGGGGGADDLTTSPSQGSGKSGGTGGGGVGGATASGTGPGGTGNTPSTSPSQGANGGTGFDGTNYGAGGGGGGGASGATGGNGTATTGGAGGAGTASSITGSSVTYAGGGGGGTYNGGTAGVGGAGGGGAGSNVYASAGVAGTVNLGGGGGGGAYVAPSGASAGGNGGSGVVIISYTSATPLFIGGTLTTSGGNQIHTFTSSGTLSPLTPVTASYLVVAGGGGGGSVQGGGGGAGGLQTSSTTIYSGATYVVTVGGGGAGSTARANTASAGSNSVLSGTGLTTVTSVGGGAGASYTAVGSTGGSGGGGGSNSYTSGYAGTSGQGYAGGNGGTFSAAYGLGGGGGGSGGIGATAVTNGSGGNGGAGTSSSITGTSTSYAGGGGGGGDYRSANTNGGSTTGGGGAGGSGSTPNASSGTPNLGGGGGGGAFGTGNVDGIGAAGGSGTVIISYAGSQVFNGGLVTSSGGNTIHTFNATGALTPLTNNLNNSLRFRASASAYLNRTPTVAGNRQKWTWSGWVKRGLLVDATNDWRVFSARNASDYTLLSFRKTGSVTPNALYLEDSSTGINIITTQVFRDPSAWYHVVIAVDTTQATAANRVKIYINGNQVTAFNTATYPTLNGTTWMNNTVPHGIGIDIYSGDQFYDGYMTDINFVDGQQLEPYYFGNNDAYGNWKPIKYTGMYGTNGFYLTFGNTTSTTTLGYDTSGNSNNWTCNNISLTAGTTYDAMLDVPTNTSATVANYAVMNPIWAGYGTPTFSNANLTTVTTTLQTAVSTMTFPNSSKTYLEATFTAGVAARIGIRLVTDVTQYGGWVALSSGAIRLADVDQQTGLATFTTNDVIGIAVDLSANTLQFYKNNVAFGTANTITNSSDWVTQTQCNSGSGLTNTIAWNFGQRPFTYTPPTGYVALNTYNLSTPTILQGNLYMDATLYTGTGTTQVIVNQGQFKPDLVWAKNRTNAGQDNGLYDSTRGVGRTLYSNLTNAESSVISTLTAFNSNGFSGGTENMINQNGASFVGWQWQAGQGSSSSNTSGSITSTVSVNTTAGFSVVTYTGTGVNATVGHGLGVAPKFLTVKRRSAVGNWMTWHTSLTGAGPYVILSSTNGVATGAWNNTLPTSTVFSLLGSDTDENANGSTYVAYCWAEIAGFSKFTSYTGNGSADGPFIFTGFRPKWLMIKRTDTTQNWIIVDTSRDTYNVANKRLLANSSAAEDTGIPNYVDLLSNGFKCRDSNISYNASGGTYIVMAFAENPFKNANAR